MAGVAPSAETFRMFIALPVPSAVKDELRRLQSEMRERLPGDFVRWTRPAQIHLTLKFLGNVAAGKVEELIVVTRAICNQFTPLHLRAQGLGIFPQSGLPRVIWAGLHESTGELGRFKKAIDEALNGLLGLPGESEEKFAPHLTIARVRKMRSWQANGLKELVVNMRTSEFGGWTAINLEVMRSELTGAGSHYHCLAELALESRESM